MQKRMQEYAETNARICRNECKNMQKRMQEYAETNAGIEMWKIENIAA